MHDEQEKDDEEVDEVEDDFPQIGAGDAVDAQKHDKVDTTLPTPASRKAVLVSTRGCRLSSMFVSYTASFLRSMERLLQLIGNGHRGRKRLPATRCMR